jgi:hypothetical protein
MIITVDRELFLKLLAQHERGHSYTTQGISCLYEILTDLDEDGLDYIVDLDEICDFYREYNNATEAALALGYHPETPEITEDDCQFWLDVHYWAWTHPAGVIVCNLENHRGH